MTKKNNVKKSVNRSNSYYRQNMELPEIVNMDVLAYVNDDDLDRRLGYLAAERERAHTHGVETYPWEVELAYVQREIRIRNARRAAHERYVRSHPDASGYYVDEVFHDNSDDQTDGPSLN